MTAILTVDDSASVRRTIKIALTGEETTEPTFGLPAMWVSPEYREEAHFKGYTVVEVAFYPDPGNLRISPEDFTLRLTGDKSAEMRPVAPSVIARALGKKSPSQIPSIKSPVEISTTNTIGYETYPTYDQSGRPRQSGGVVTGAGVGVGTGVGGGGRAPDRIPDNDRESIEAELANRSLQEDTISQPTAGFLYFRNSNSKKKDAAYELQYAPNSDSAPVTPVKLVIPKL